MSYSKRLYEQQRMEEIAWEARRKHVDWRFEELGALEKMNQTENKNKPKN